ncbi:hypothetical protein SAMN04490243_0493 [Robiginitalea myxolifaciens]|uniref:Uncharacterized protein n=1 Tax=Robiginitalea myxolifaciens TaxID=400055 RepID=A0A1I6FRD0_9FLAO|nr:hypothetical protein [Robiginitalea myxolifaciens]SFR32464.1 hypothetical protein SAMN04490243_0493 [Robiginitalea myxolifaciens]
MAPVEFEKNLREKLRDRKITPAADSWDRIASQLGPEPKRKQAIIKPWMYAVAAAVVLFLALRTVLFQGAELPPTQEVVVSPETEKVSEEDKQQPERSENEGESVLPDEQDIQEDIAPEVEKKREEILYGGIKPEPIKEEVLAMESENSNIESDSILMNQRIDREIDSLLTRLAVLESDGEQISDATIDSLLREAEVALAGAPKISNTGTVDATALLSEVEVELDRSFREELFDQLKSRFTKVRLAMAQRNQ